MLLLAVPLGTHDAMHTLGTRVPVCFQWDSDLTAEGSIFMATLIVAIRVASIWASNQIDTDAKEYDTRITDRGH